MRTIAITGGTAFLLILTLAGEGLSRQQERKRVRLSFEETTKKQEKAAERGIRWLFRHQNVDGLWGCQRSGAPSAAVTGVAILALASTGSSPKKGRYAARIRKAVERLIKVQSASGQITLGDATGLGPFYDHATATLALSEIYGMMQDERDDDRIRRGLSKAIRYLYRTQGRDGGWNKTGSGGTSDLAITCAVWMALRSAHGAGLHIEMASVKKVVKFVSTCKRPRGGYSQMPRVAGGGTLLFYPTAAGLRILYGMGRGDMKEVAEGTKVILESSLGKEHKGRVSEWDYCGAFYSVQALLHEDGKAWKTYYPKLRGELLKRQNRDGSWTVEYCTCCKAYATALAVLCLQAPKRMLPIFQL